MLSGAVDSALDPGAANPLAELRGLHLPPDPGFWPLAPGWWWLIAGLVLAVVALAALWVWVRRRPQRARARLQQAVLGELDTIHAAQAYADDIDYLAAVSALLRRTDRTTRGPNGVGLAGQAWADYLRGHADEARQISSSWELLAQQRYQRSVTADRPAVYADCRQWLLRAVHATPARRRAW